MVGLVMFGLMARVVVLIIGDICKLATKTIQFGLGSVLVNSVAAKKSSKCFKVSYF